MVDEQKVEHLGAQVWEKKVEWEKKQRKIVFVANTLLPRERSHCEIHGGARVAGKM